jgi:secreted trypsin-like serine protease
VDQWLQMADLLVFSLGEWDEPGAQYPGVYTKLSAVRSWLVANAVKTMQVEYIAKYSNN